MSYLEILRLALPETAVVVTALAVLAVDLLALREQPVRIRFGLGATIASLGCVLAIVFALGRHEHANLFHGMFVVDSLTNVVKAAILGLTISRRCFRRRASSRSTLANTSRSSCWRRSA